MPGTNIVVDPIEILDGDAAIAEAVKRGQAAPGPDGKPFVPNDYFTVNDDKSTVTLRVAPDASVMLNVDGGGPKPASLDDAVKLGKTGNIPVSLPFRITVQGTGAEARIVKIDHIFTP